MSRKLLKVFRLTHLYLGVFITPALIFFAFTGAIQSFGLHETNRDHPDYKPARWLVVLGQIHKKQTPVVPVRRPQPPAGSVAAAPGAGPGLGPASEGGQSAAGQGPERRHRGPDSAVAPGIPGGDSSKPAAAPMASSKHHPLPLRIFFLIVSIGLFISTVTGLYMSYVYIRNKLLITVTLVAGIVIPLVLVFV